ncbi:Mitochondrial grpe [Mycena sanguinolenta]|uniref:GrpE protein homolog, mitochondrial n=1 Tax=Mycena sanguinolenta TaxID=230812 RepID=A0A8H6YLN9_9AGAR|nr:Mitochondrial grpe [Mycena sanguinolenta]
MPRTHPPSPQPALNAELVKAQEEAADLLGRLRYLQADFLNLQRNSAREREKTRDFAITSFAGDLLETVDVLSLALKSVPQSALEQPSDDSVPEPSPDAPSSPSRTKTSDDYLRELYTGVEMTQRQLLSTLFKYQIKPFNPTGDPFDPNRHEALYQAPVPGKTPGTVIDCQKTGFTIRDRVLRAAQVGVAQEMPQAPVQETAEQSS